MSNRTPPNQGPPGLQYPKLPPDTHSDLNNAVRNIFDNLFYIRRMVDGGSKLSPSQLTEVKRIIGDQFTTILNTVNNIVQNIVNNTINNTFISGCIVGSHNLRLTTYGAASQSIGTLFYETDRHVLYVIAPTPNHWQFVAGIMLGVFADQPGDLGSNDVGFLYFATDTTTLYVWDGSAFIEISGSGSDFCYIPMVTGAEPIEIMSDGAGHLLLVAIDVPQ